MAKSASRSEHRANQLLATLAPADFVALEPHLETVKLSKSTTVYETGDDMPYAYFPHDAVVSLITVLTDGKTVEVAVFGREALLGLTSALATCRSLGRYVVQVSGTASRVDTEALRRVLKDRPAVRELCLRLSRRWWRRLCSRWPATRYTVLRRAAAAGSLPCTTGSAGIPFP